jgi:selenocysteine lyase/cysteine desulfurase
MEAIREYEMSLSRELVRVLSKSGAKIYGASHRFRLASIDPDGVVRIEEQGIDARDGLMYSPR